MSDKIFSALMATEIDWGLVGSTVVTGLVVVFLILAVLVFFLWAFGKIFGAINNAADKRERKKLIERNDAMRSFRLQNSSDVPKPAPGPSPAVSPEPVEDEYEDEDDDEIIAVIAAAIAAYGAAEGKQYRITRVQRPKSARSGWSAAGIAENMRGFIN
jgi:Na+-transporting methylmalonyl-CoA/oxaloacetate decarboxylase gamma subunit